MEVAHHLTTTGGISSVTTSYWVKTLHVSLKARMNLNGTK